MKSFISKVLLAGVLIPFAYLCNAQENKMMTIVQSSESEPEMLKTIGKAGFSPDTSAIENGLIRIFPEIRYQKIYGIGGTFTESSAYNFMSLGKENRTKLAEALFSKENGLGLNLCRVPIGSNDFSISDYTHVKGTDPELKTFNIKRDCKYIIPMIQSALEYNKDIEFLASPWSPPAFMKTNGKRNEGGSLLPEYRDAWAEYFVKFLESYSEKGIDFSLVSVQNEPKAWQTWESCKYTAKEEGEFAVNYLRPHLDNAGFKDIGIIIWDHNKERAFERASGTLAIEGAMEKIWGIGLHWYSGRHFGVLEMVHEKFPDKPMILTEFCKGPATGGRNIPYGDWSDVEDYAEEIIGDFNCHVAGIIDFNMCLDTHAGPYHYRGNGGKAPVVVDAATDSYELQQIYYALGHFSKYIQKGAVRIGCSCCSESLMSTAFVNPDGSMTVVILNKSNTAFRPIISLDGNIAEFYAPARSLTTLVIN